MLNDLAWLAVIFIMRVTDCPALAFALLAAALAGCASVSTQVTLLDPAQNFAPTEHVVVLFDYPPQPYIKVALIEAQGVVGGTEAALIEEARGRARRGRTCAS